MSFSESLVPLPRTIISKPVALGSSVPQWPTFSRRKARRRASTTSCEVGPAGLSMRTAPSNGERLARDARAGGGGVATSSELAGNLIDIDAGSFGAEADASQLGFHLLKN